jgi:hypothetical protein
VTLSLKKKKELQKGEKAATKYFSIFLLNKRCEAEAASNFLAPYKK